MTTHPSPFPPYQQVPPRGRDLEPPELKYARQTRTAVVVIAWIAGVVFIASMAWGIILGIQVAKMSNELNTGTATSTSASNCQPGSAIPGC
jgi:hypothetical protein